MAKCQVSQKASELPGRKVQKILMLYGFPLTLLRSRMSKQGQIDKRVRDPINKNLLQRKFSSFPLDFEFWLRQAEKLKGKEESSFEE